MTTRAGLIVGTLASSLAVAGAAALLHAREQRFPAPEVPERLLSLTSGKTADRVFLTFDPVAADVYWIRAIQHYGRDRRALGRPDRFGQLQPLLDLTTTLDPYFNIAYRFGAIFLSIEPPFGPGRTDEAITLLEKGLRNNPTRWQYAHDIGFIHYWYTGDYVAAARWFERAAAMPNAPAWIQPLVPLTLAQGGDRKGARQMLTELLTADQPFIRQAAERGLQQLQALDAIDELQALVERYQATTGTYPSSWGDLIRAGLLRGLPADTQGTAFTYDAASHTVMLSPLSSLGPLPKRLAQQ